MISLNDLVPDQIEAARRLKNEIMERFAREVSTGHFVQDVNGTSLALGEEIEGGTFRAIELATKTERLVKVEECTRELPFVLSFEARLEFEALSQELNESAAQRDLPGDLYSLSLQIIGKRYTHEDPNWERERGATLHRLYIRFPAFAEREFRAEQAIKANWDWDEHGIYYLPNFADEDSC